MNMEGDKCLTRVRANLGRAKTRGFAAINNFVVKVRLTFFLQNIMVLFNLFMNN
jgi:hypothetical protein